MRKVLSKEKVLFSIIVVCKNEERVIENTLCSVINQTYSNFEIIVQDGKSTDNTISLVNRLKGKDNRIKIVSEEDNGIYSAMNKALTKVEGEYVYFLNAGDAFYDERVLFSIDKCIREKKPDIILGRYLSKRHEQEIIVTPIEEKSLLEHVKEGNGICHQSIFAQKDCLLDGFDENYKFSADFDWVCKQVKDNKKIINTDTVIAKYDKFGISSLAKNWKRVQAECKDIIQRNFQVDSKTADRYYVERYRIVKSQKMLECMNDFLALKQKNKDLCTYFEKRGIKTVAIYGYHFLGQRLHEELMNTLVRVKYIIDRNCVLQNVGIPLISLNNELEKVDAIVITPIFDYYEIKDVLEQKINCTILSIEDVINGMYE